MPRYKLFFADLHFHTNYSDNRDGATIEEMILEGQRYSIAVFGIGDHNHSLDRQKWRQETEESARLQRKYPSLTICNNCEITFLLGHFLVVEPEAICGTIQEGYDFLFKNRDIVKIINHPHPQADEWHRRIIPSAAGVEVINGALFRQAKEAGYRFKTALEIPFLQTYAKYLRLGYPVAAIGNSDAHELVEMGCGLTGLWLEDPIDKAQVIQAIRERRTFATTDSGICIKGHLDQRRREFSWKVTWNPKTNPLAAGQFRIEVYNMDQKLATAEGNGCIAIVEEGLYWIAAFNEEAIAVSSPVESRKIHSVAAGAKRIIKDKSVFKDSLKDMLWLKLRQQSSLDLSSFKKEAVVEVELLSRTRDPEIIDADGNRVRYTVLQEGKERIVIDKSCNSPCFDEFFLWLERNEIHEYMFLEMEYTTQGDLFLFDGLLVPAKMVHRKYFSQRYRDEIPRIKSLLGPKTRFHLYVRTLFQSTVRIDLRDHPFPMKVGESLLLWNEQKLDTMTLSQFLGVESMQEEDVEPGQRIFQIFL